MPSKTPRRIFFFTGLGADERAFTSLKINAPFQKIYVSWLPPEENESLIAYARRLSIKYNIRKEDILIGLSFGGMVVTEISRDIKPSLTLLISSASTRQELPLPYKIAGFLHLDTLLPAQLLSRPGRLKHYLFGLKKPEQKKLFDEIITGADVNFTRWAISRIVRWNNKDRPQNLFKIHGTADRILPIHPATTDFIISGGSHFLTWEKADEVSEIINELIAKNEFSPDNRKL
jgi:pimeloyl-ACP methyl ester carboxylesterase